MMNILHWNDLKDLSIVFNSVCNNEIMLCSTDTVLGLLGNISKISCDKLNMIKERTDKPYIILLSSIEKAIHFSPSFKHAKLHHFVQKCWPGPVTLIVKANPYIPDYMRQNNTIALRIPNHAGLLSLLEKFDGLFSTSGNKTGKPVPTTLDEVDQNIIKMVTHIIIDQEDQIQTTASTILDCTQEDRITVVREGAYPIAELEKLYGRLFKLT